MFDWNTLLLSDSVKEALETAQASGQIRKDFPELQAIVGFGGGNQGHKDLWEHTKQVVAQSEPKLEIRWAALFHDVGKPKAFRRKGRKVEFHAHEAISSELWRSAMSRHTYLTPEQVDHVDYLISNLGQVEAYISSWSDSGVRRLGKTLGALWHDALLLSRADMTTKHEYKRQAHLAKSAELEARILRIREEDARVPPLPKGIGGIIAEVLGIPPSRRLGEIKQAMEKAVAEGTLEGHRELDYYREWLKSTFRT